MAYLRFAGLRRDQDSGVEQGLFQIAHSIRLDAATSRADEVALREQLAWFNKNLPEPQRFNQTRSKGFYRRKPRGISWFKDTATGCLSRMHTLKRIAEEHGFAINVIREERIGYVVYEDEFQVVAEPFRETQTH